MPTHSPAARRTPRRSHLKRAGALAATGGAAALLAACGGGASASGSSDSSKSEQAALNFARCMREHGVNVPDPKPGQKGLTFSARTGPGKSPPNALPAADRACRHLLRGALKRPSASELNKMRDAALKWAQCMRQHGVKVPDPATGDGGIRIQVGPGGGVGPNDPTFQKADRECRHLLPGGGPGRSTGSSRAGGSGEAGGASLQSSG